MTRASYCIKRYCLWPILGTALVLSPMALGEESSTTGYQPNIPLTSPSPYSLLTQKVLITCLLILQTLLIIGLQRSRINHKRTKKDLKRTQRELEQRIIDRTEKLRAINNQLYEEIAKHEITEELLEETQEYLHSIINSMPSILIGVTRQGYITHWNAAAERSTDIRAQAALGKHINNVCPELPVKMETIQDAIDRTVPQVKENIQHGTGSQASYTDLTVYPLVSSEVTGAVIRVDDVTMRVRIENMMIQNEKMMSLGELAAGMAHEINNPLSAILHGVQNIYRRTSTALEANHKAAAKLNIEVQQVHEYLKERDIFTFIDGIRDARERSAKIVTNMLEFSRGNTRKHAPVDIVELLEHSLELAHNTFEMATPEGVEQLNIIKEFDEQLPAVPCSAAEIQQVLLNLLRNACQAFCGPPEEMPIEPQIHIRARKDQGCVRVEVEDNGPGMDERVKRHIFEPFFTTKDVGKGTGLGLSVSYFIITEHHDGTIEVDSSQGKGTLFTIKLPLSQEMATEALTNA